MSSEIAERSEDRCPPGWCRSQEIARLRTALAEAKQQLNEAEEARNDAETRLLAQLAALAEAEQKLTSLRPSVAEMERDEMIARAERAEAALDGARAQCRADIAAIQREIARAERAESDLIDKSRQIAELQEQLHHMFGIEQSRDRAEADLAAAREFYRNVDEKDWAQLRK